MSEAAAQNALAEPAASRAAGDTDRSNRSGPARFIRIAVPLLGIMGGIQIADPNISSIALVKASNDLEFSASVSALAASIMTLALAASVIASGLMGDRLGRRRVLLAALALTATADIIVAVSPHASVYLLGRILTGIGLGAVFACAFAYIRVVAADNLGAAMGIFGGMGGAVALVAGLAGGALADTSWRAAYLVIPTLSLLCIPAVLVVLPREEPVPGKKTDFLGLFLIAGGAAGILYGLSNAALSPGAPETWAPILGGLVALGLFVLTESRSSHAVFPIGLFRKPLFVAAVLAGVGWNMAQATSSLQLSNLWQYVDKYSTLGVTLGLLPMLGMGIIFAFVAGRLLARGRSPRTILILGFTLLCTGFVLLGILPLETSYLIFIAPLLLIGVGLPLCATVQGHAFMVQAPADDYGPVTSSRLTVGQFGFSLGIAGSAVLISRLTDLGIAAKLHAAGVPPSQTGEGLDAVTLYVRHKTEASTEAGRVALANAASSYADAFHGTMIIAAVLMAAIGAACWLLMRSEGRKKAAGTS